MVPAWLFGVVRDEDALGRDEVAGLAVWCCLAKRALRLGWKDRCGCGGLVFQAEDWFSRAGVVVAV